MPPALLFFPQDCFWLFRIFCGSVTTSRIFSVKNAVGILIRIVLNLWISLGSAGVFSVLVFSVHDNGLSFHVFVISVSLLDVL